MMDNTTFFAGVALEWLMRQRADDTWDVDTQAYRNTLPELKEAACREAWEWAHTMERVGPYVTWEKIDKAESRKNEPAS